MWRPRRQLDLTHPAIRAWWVARFAQAGFIVGMLLGFLLLAWLGLAVIVVR
jgi:hypothetical protein